MGMTQADTYIQSTDRGGTCSQDASPEQRILGIFTPSGVVQFVVLGGLFLFLQRYNLQRLIRIWQTDNNWSHGFLVPLFSAYFIFQHRFELAAERPRVSLAGLPIIIAGLVIELAAYWIFKNDLLKDCAMIMVLFGIVLYMAGWRVMRIVWLPILFLGFAVKIPYIVYDRIALPLQKLAAVGGVLVLRVAGVHAQQLGTTINIYAADNLLDPIKQLNVEEACSGMRLLMAFLALGVAMAYLSDRPVWQRIILVLLAVPIAVFCNVVRVSGTGLLYYMWTDDAARGFFHQFSGLVMLPVAFVIYLGAGWVLSQLLIDDVEEDLRIPPAPPPFQPERHEGS
jgi:exosortase